MDIVILILTLLLFVFLKNLRYVYVPINGKLYKYYRGTPGVHFSDYIEEVSYLPWYGGYLSENFGEILYVFPLWEYLKSLK